MREKEKKMHQLKREVLLAYMSKKTPGLSKKSKQHWEERYTQSKKELSEAIENESRKQTM